MSPELPYTLRVDVATVCLLMPIIWGLRLPIKSRISLCVIFGLEGVYVSCRSDRHSKAYRYSISICIISSVRLKAWTDITTTDGTYRDSLGILLTLVASALGVNQGLSCAPYSANSPSGKACPQSQVKGLYGLMRALTLYLHWRSMTRLPTGISLTEMRSLGSICFAYLTASRLNPTLLHMHAADLDEHPIGRSGTVERRTVDTVQA